MPVLCLEGLEIEIEKLMCINIISVQESCRIFISQCMHVYLNLLDNVNRISEYSKLI